MAAEVKKSHRVGIGWRPEIASFILEHEEFIDDIEIIVENFLDLSKKNRDTLKFLNSFFDIHFHSVSLGIAGSQGIPLPLLKTLKRFFSFFPIEGWSDHFSFVRAGSLELGHLGAPPRNEETIEIVLKNLRLLKKELGHFPILENVSTLLNPPLSTMSETEWMKKILDAVDGRLLLDINNVYCNAVNFGHDPLMELLQYPFHRVSQIHMSGGKWIHSASRGHMLDDHQQDIPEIGFKMLELALTKLNHPISVIIERDGNFPESEVLKYQLWRIKDLIQSNQKKKKEVSNELLRL